MTAGDYPEREYDDRVIEGVFDSPGNTTDTQTEGEAPIVADGSDPGTPGVRLRGTAVPDHDASPSVCVSGLRGLVEKATAELGGGRIIDVAARLDARDTLVDLAPDLALWAADAADALQNWKGQNHGFTRRGKPRRGCNLKTIHGCQPCRLLARFAVIEHTAQEDTP